MMVRTSLLSEEEIVVKYSSKLLAYPYCAIYPANQVGMDGMDCDDLDRDALGINDDNLSDMVSANVSGRGTPNVSGRDTPSSQVTEGDGTPMEGGSRGSQPPAEGSQAEGGGGQGQHQQGPRRPSITAAAGSDSGRDQPRDEDGPARRVLSAHVLQNQ